MQKNKLNIAIFQNLPDGGALRTVYEQVRGLSKHHIIDMYCFSKPEYKDLYKYINSVNITDFNIDSEGSGVFWRLAKDYKNFVSLRLIHKKIANEIYDKDYDLVLVHSDKWTESPFILRYLKMLNIYHCHELLRIAYENFLNTDNTLSVNKRIYEKATRYIRKRIDLINAQSAQKIVTSSIYMKDKVKLFYKRNAFLCYAGVDMNIFKNTVNKKTNYVLFIGKKDKVKGYDTYLKLKDIFKNMKYINFNELAVKDNTPLVINDDRKLSKIYSDALCFLCLSRQEPFGLTALESMACETPVLAVNEGGYKETVIDGVTGYLLPRDPKAFAEKIEFLIKNPDIARKMGKAGRKHVKKNFTWKKHNRKLEKILLKYAKENKK